LLLLRQSTFLPSRSHRIATPAWCRVVLTLRMGPLSRGVSSCLRPQLRSFRVGLFVHLKKLYDTCRKMGEGQARDQYRRPHAPFRNGKIVPGLSSIPPAGVIEGRPRGPHNYTGTRTVARSPRLAVRAGDVERDRKAERGAALVMDAQASSELRETLAIIPSIERAAGRGLIFACGRQGGAVFRSCPRSQFELAAAHRAFAN
jgi:hypothetical protein